MGRTSTKLRSTLICLIIEGRRATEGGCDSLSVLENPELLNMPGGIDV
jgi:hypothetical protein